MSVPTPPNGTVSNTELILRKILGEDVTPLPPNSRVEFYLQQVEEYIERLATGATRPIGETTTALTDGATTNPIKIDGEDYTAQINDIVFYGNKEFLFTVNGWREVGDITNLNADMIDDTNTTKKFTNATEKETWNGKQDAIDSSHKLSADLVDDTNSTNKFTDATEKQTWNGKQDALVFETAYDPSTNKAATVSDIPTSGSSTPQMDGTASAGSATTWSRSDHVHPSDTSKQNEVLGSWTAGSATTHSTPTSSDTVLQALQKIDNNQRLDESNISSKIGASDYASQNTGGTVRVWTTTDGTDTILHISNEAPTP